MILVGQAKTWYANDPENNVIRDIKRKVVIALFLMIPNFAVLGKLSCYPCYRFSGFSLEIGLKSRGDRSHTSHSCKLKVRGSGKILLPWFDLFCCFVNINMGYKTIWSLLGSGVMMSVTMFSHTETFESWNVFGLAIGTIAIVCFCIVYWLCWCFRKRCLPCFAKPNFSKYKMVSPFE